MGLGPTRLLGAHVSEQELEALGWRVRVDSVQAVDETLSELARVFELDRRLAGQVSAAIAEGAFPLVLAGNCISCLGTVAGADADGIGVVWFDAHADFDTPDDNLSGFLDVMGLAILTGSGWRALRETIPGFGPVAEEKVVLAGVRDLEPYQRARLERSHIRTVPGPRWRAGDFEAALEELHGRVDRVYLHIDLDALDLTEGTANEYAAPAGLTLDQLLAAVRAVFARFRVSAAALTAYDPGYDADGRLAQRASAIVYSIAQETLRER
jgi:arginase